MKRYPTAILRVHTESGPDAAGATSEASPQGDPGGARRRPRLCYPGIKRCASGADSSPDSRPGTDGNHSCGFGDTGRPARTRPPPSVVNDAALHPAGNRDDLAGDVAGELVRGEDDDLARHVLGLCDLA